MSMNIASAPIPPSPTPQPPRDSHEPASAPRWDQTSVREGFDPESSGSSKSRSMSPLPILALATGGGALGVVLGGGNPLSMKARGAVTAGILGGALLGAGVSWIASRFNN